MIGRFFKNQNIMAGSVLILVGVLMLANAIIFGQVITSKIGADFFPKIISTGIILVGTAILVNGLREFRKELPADTGKANVSIPGNYPALGITVALLIIYVLLLGPLGFIVTTIPFTFLLMLLITPRSRRKYLTFAIVSIVSTIATYFLFARIFYVILPRGILG